MEQATGCGTQSYVVRCSQGSRGEQTPAASHPNRIVWQWAEIGRPVLFGMGASGLRGFSRGFFEDGRDMSTFVPSGKDISRKWYVVDASGQTLGRLATKAASVLIDRKSVV